MQRFTFCVLVALLTFGISSFITLKLFWKVKDSSANVASLEFVNRFSAQNTWKRPFAIISGEPSQKIEAPTKPFCHNSRILPIWNKLIKEKSFQDWWKDSTESLDCADMLEIKEFDLDQDGRKEIFLRGKNFNLCSAVGNCAFWIYKKQGKSLKQLLYSTDHIYLTAMGNQAEKTRTNGYFDILLKGHLSASDTSYEFYKFDGKEYKPVKQLVQACIVCTGDNPKWELVSLKKYEKFRSY